MDEPAAIPAWAEWPAGPHPLGEFTIGVEEEVMLVSAMSNALANRIDHGVWGGTSERERRRIIKARAREKLATAS